MNVSLSRLHFPVTTLGVGSRIGVWFQGCSIKCPGCVSKDTWETAGGGTTIESVLAALSPWLQDADGITISGGEPFDQPEALRALLASLRNVTREDILVYSGYAWERIQPTVTAWGGLIDVLISEPFDPKAGQTLIWRGSDNQRMHLLTPLGESIYREMVNAERSIAPQALDVFIEDGEVWMAGIPNPGDLKALQTRLAQAGYRSKTSEANGGNGSELPIFA